MIAFEELVVALDRWRVRNGLAVATTDLPPAAELPRQPLPVSATPAYTPAPAAYTPAATAVSQVVSAAAAVTPRAQTDDEIALDEDVMEEDEYNTAGNDFAMSFGATGSSSPVVSGGGWQGGAVSGEVGGSGPQPLYDEAAYAEPAYSDPVDGGYDPDSQTYVAPDAAAYAAPYGEAPPAAEPLAYEAQPVGEGDVEGEEDEDWSKLYPQAAGPDTLDAAADDIVDEANAVGDDFDPDALLPKR
jgi:hypothetical protein